MMEPGFGCSCCPVKHQKWQSVEREENAQGEWTMGPYDGLTPEERARITEIQDCLIDRYVERSEALERGDTVGVRAIDQEIKALRREKEQIQEWATALSQ
jgi:hypothetical protein